jgi:hypothetical protein
MKKLFFMLLGLMFTSSVAFGSFWSDIYHSAQHSFSRGSFYNHGMGFDEYHRTLLDHETHYDGHTIDKHVNKSRHYLRYDKDRCNGRKSRGFFTTYRHIDI